MNWSFSSRRGAALARAAHVGVLKLTEKAERNTQILTYDHIFIVLIRQTQFKLCACILSIIN